MAAHNVSAVDCIFKLGGAAITIKHEFESLNEKTLSQAAEHAATLYENGVKMIIVHGAGSFGHFQASAAGIGRGGDTEKLGQTAVLEGFAQTRLSVTKLNHIVVSALMQRGIPAVGVSPLGSWKTRDRAVVLDGCSYIASLVQQGFVPVVHGDAVLDEVQKFTILGGDPIMTRLCEYFRPKSAVFMSNVVGICDRPPSQPNCKLLRKIVVDKSGSWKGYGTDGTEIETIETSTLEHDTTGGVEKKVAEAIDIVKNGIPVMVVEAGSEAALEACMNDELSEGEWIGTEILSL